jgi:hypothetical protein
MFFLSCFGVVDFRATPLPSKDKPAAIDQPPYGTLRDPERARKNAHLIRLGTMRRKSIDAVRTEWGLNGR